ncbi:MAG TPA: OmpA family protein [Polyangiaceae bacterium]|jgi:peptidoglycan-associated lipoprotein|nr:OmpA family protein [Polyangiaceae bacterium]
MTILIRSVLAVCCCVGLACSAATPAARNALQPPPSKKSNVTVVSADVPASDTSSNINVAPAIREACGLSAHEAYFAYDAANVSSRDDQLLEKLAQCFIKGNMFGRNMALVGHADPRGDEEYNVALGGRRADAIQEALIKKGLDALRVRTSSRGEYDAQGNEESGWAKDRRVDVLLAD